MIDELTYTHQPGDPAGSERMTPEFVAYGRKMRAEADLWWPRRGGGCGEL
jgi:hypothetical protein